MSHRQVCVESEKSSSRRRGNILVVVAFFMIGLSSVVAFAVDYGYLLVVRTDMQRAADAAALAAVRELVPSPIGEQVEADQARKVAREYVALNLRSNVALTIPDEDIEVGRYDPSTINSGNVTILDDGMMDTVRVKLRRDGVINKAVSLFFGRILSVNQAKMEVYATAVLRPAGTVKEGSMVLPIALNEESWKLLMAGQDVSIYGDSKVIDSLGNEVPGNWGTVDVGDTSNSTRDIKDQIDNGLRQSDLDYLASSVGPDGEMRIPNSDEIPVDTWLQGDPGLSAGIHNSLVDAVGEIRLIPIVDQIVSDPGGGKLEYHVVQWGVVEIVSANLHGNSTIRNLTVTKRFGYDGALKPAADLSDTTDVIEGAFGPAGLVE